VNVEELIEALWPGSDPARARPRLWKAAHQARRLLGEGLVRRGTAYALAADRISVDVREVERLGRAAAELPALERALALSTGAPLADVDYLWADAPRRHLRAVRGELLARAGRLRLRAGEPRLALGAAEELIALDRLHEPGWRLAMEAEAALGARQAVIARYDALSEELARDYGLRPQAQTRSIFRSLLAQG
jgi:DNA-binding SARP family transcriptional activator